MHILLSGGSGLIGSALREDWLQRGWHVTQLVRDEPTQRGQVRWNPADGWVDATAFDGVDVVVNLAGAGVGDKRWTDDYKKTILRSRVDTTKTLATTMAGLTTPPRQLVQASAVGFYGDRGDEVLTEQSEPGSGFLAQVCVEWERASEPCRAANIDVATIRTGLVMAPGGGAFARLMPPFKLGLGGPLGSGQMWWPWITLVDEVAAINFIITEQLSGAVNLVAPQPVRNVALTRSLGRALGRPTLLPIPRKALELALGEFAGDVMASQRVEPSVLLDAGFVFDHAQIDAATRWLVDAA